MNILNLFLSPARLHELSDLVDREVVKYPGDSTFGLYIEVSAVPDGVGVEFSNVRLCIGVLPPDSEPINHMRPTVEVRP